MVALILLSGCVLAVAAAGGSALLGLYPLLPSDLGGVRNLDRKARRERIPVGAGDWIDGWYLSGTHPAVVIIFHGYGRNHHRAWRYASFLRAAGFAILAVDFRSSRYRERKPTTLGHFELEDARAALDWVRREPGLEGHRIALMGESLGGSVALMLAAESPDVAAVVADCAFSHGCQALGDSCERWARVPRWPSAETNWKTPSRFSRAPIRRSSNCPRSTTRTRNGILSRPWSRPACQRNCSSAVLTLLKRNANLPQPMPVSASPKPRSSRC